MQVGCYLNLHQWFLRTILTCNFVIIGVFFRIAAAEHCVFALLSFFRSGLIGGPVYYAREFEGTTVLVDSCVLLP